MAWLFLRGKDLQTDAGMELLALCQSITGDGVIADEEVFALKDWLARYEKTDLAGAEHLRRIVGQILEDGEITPDERTLVHTSVESVLPPEFRHSAITKRREARATERARAKQEREAEAEETKRNRPVAVLDVMVAGIAFEGRAGLIHDTVRANDRAFLQRDPENRYSRHAVKVLNKHGQQIGFIPDGDAADAFPLLASGHKHVAMIKKVLERGRYPIPVVTALIYPPEADAASGGGCVAESEIVSALVPAPAASPHVRRSTAVLVLVAVLVAMVLVIVFVSLSE